ncbi:DUF1350 family protein [Alkalinema pantanalense CENA528]|uniref:DUF1350 family protein n=1 Tax=Alkalinema pantanalense TaxID=1620705 RepID=UPI003D6DF3F0
MIWQEVAGNWVLLPPRPVAIVHFLGGAFVATAPQLTYRRLLECLARSGYGLIATPFINTFDHIGIAENVLWSFDRALHHLQSTGQISDQLPIYGLGHSMGCKLHLLIGSVFEVERSGNLLMAFNNFAARDSIPLMDQFSQVLQQFAPLTSSTIDFTPSPDATNQLIAQQYAVSRNLLVKFSNDTLDQTRSLANILQVRFPDQLTLCKLKGNHLTPVAQDLQWETGAIFTPFDAIGQWVRQEVFRELQQLEQVLLDWLNVAVALESQTPFR